MKSLRTKGNNRQGVSKSSLESKKSNSNLTNSDLRQLEPPFLSNGVDLQKDASFNKREQKMYQKKSRKISQLRAVQASQKRPIDKNERIFPNE